MAPSNGESRAVPASTIARYTLVVVAILAAALFVWQIKEALLMAFAGGILAVFWTGVARSLRRLVPVSRTVSLIAVAVLILLFFGLFGLLFGGQMAEQFSELTEQLPEQVTELQESIQEQPWGQYLLDGGGGGGSEEGAPQGGGGQEGEQQNQSQGTGGGSGGMLFEAAATTVDVIATLILILFVGIFFAARPELYRFAITVLVPKEHTRRVEEALQAAGQALWQWLTGQLLAMVFVGIAVGVGLSLVGVPLAPVLGLIAALFNFVPYVGPIAAAVPALLLAWLEGTDVLLMAALVMWAAQQLEGDLVTPLIQRNRVSIPPAFVLLAVVAFGLVFGIPGVVLATPLAVIGMVLVGMLYVQDVLGKDIEVPGQGAGG